jgi:hypothetical protein
LYYSSIRGEADLLDTLSRPDLSEPDMDDLLKIIPKYNNIVLFTDDTSILITDSNNIDFNINNHQSNTSLVTWFNSNMLTLNFNKTHYIEFKTKNYYQVQVKVQYEHKDISNSAETKFLGLIIDETLSWNQHIDWIATKLCSACYVLTLSLPAI